MSLTFPPFICKPYPILGGFIGKCLGLAHEGMLFLHRANNHAGETDRIELLFETLFGGRTVVHNIDVARKTFYTIVAHLDLLMACCNKQYRKIFLVILRTEVMFRGFFCITARGYFGRVSRNVKKGNVLAVILGGPALRTFRSEARWIRTIFI